MPSEIKLPLTGTFFLQFATQKHCNKHDGEKNKRIDCTQWEFVTSLNKFLSNYVGYPHTSSAATSSLLQPHLRAAAVAAAAASAGSHGHHAGNNVCGSAAVAAAERQAAAERSRQMGPNSISRDRSNDSNNGHNSEDDTNLSGVEEMEESITGKFFFSNPAMFNFGLWADMGQI